MMQEVGRISFAEAAFKESESTVRFKYRRLVERGVIRGLVALVDPRAVRLNESATPFVKANAAKLDDMLHDLCTLKEVPHVYPFMADYNVTAIVMGRDIDDLATIVRRVKGIPGVIDVMMMLTLRVLKSDVKHAIAGASGEKGPRSP